MRSTVREVLRLAGRSWPLLLLWFLGGWIVRWVVIRIAAELGAIDATLGLIVLPIAVLARLVSYIGMFLVLRDSMPTFTRLARGNVTDGSVEETALGFRDILLSSVLVFSRASKTVSTPNKSALWPSSTDWATPGWLRTRTAFSWELSE